MLNSFLKPNKMSVPLTLKEVITFIFLILSGDRLSNTRQLPNWSCYIHTHPQAQTTSTTRLFSIRTSLLEFQHPQGFTTSHFSSYTGFHRWKDSHTQTIKTLLQFLITWRSSSDDFLQGKRKGENANTQKRKLLHTATLSFPWTRTSPGYLSYCRKWKFLVNEKQQPSPVKEFDNWGLSTTLIVL